MRIKEIIATLEIMRNNYNEIPLSGENRKNYYDYQRKLEEELLVLIKEELDKTK